MKRIKPLIWGVKIPDCFSTILDNILDFITKILLNTPDFMTNKKWECNVQ